MKEKHISFIHDAVVKNGGELTIDVDWRPGYISRIELYFKSRNVVEVPTLYLNHKRVGNNGVDIHSSSYTIDAYREEFLLLVYNRIKNGYNNRFV